MLNPEPCTLNPLIKGYVKKSPLGVKLFNADGDSSGYLGCDIQTRATWPIVKHPISLTWQRGCHFAECRFGFRADGANRRQTHNHDQRQHHRIFNRGGSILANEETTQLQG
jgi:hypothetical protein